MACAKDKSGTGCIWDINENVVRQGLNERDTFRGELKAVLQCVGNKEHRKILKQENKVSRAIFSEALFDKMLPFGLCGKT